MVDISLGGNCCIKQGIVYARTHKHPAQHPWFSTIKQQTHLLDFTLENGVELYGENMTATHSIRYQNLTSYFYLFGVKHHDKWCAWDEVAEVARDLGIPTAPLRFRGVIESGAKLQELVGSLMSKCSQVGADVTPEGFVVRVARSFNLDEFRSAVAKYVREDHIQTPENFAHIYPRNKAAIGLPIGSNQ
jgi:hypothetical protein